MPNPPRGDRPKTMYCCVAPCPRRAAMSTSNWSFDAGPQNGDMNTTYLNADFDQRVVIPPPTPTGWLPSPNPACTRHRLDRMGDEVARATSIVRYRRARVSPATRMAAARSILVLDGTFSDETRRLPGRHLPAQPARHGARAVLTRRLHPVRQAVAVCRATTAAGAHRHRSTPWRQGLVPGLSVTAVARVRRRQHGAGALGARHPFNTARHPGGEEILVLAGAVPRRAGRVPGRHLAAQPALEPAHAVHRG